MARNFTQLELRFHTQPNSSYAIESCERLGPEEWSTFHSVAPKPNGGQAVVRQLIEKTLPKRYFRLRKLP